MKKTIIYLLIIGILLVLIGSFLHTLNTSYSNFLLILGLSLECSATILIIYTILNKRKSV
jgi:purine-cytosine permease-like protein